MSEATVAYSFVTNTDAKAYLSRASVTVDDDVIAIINNLVASAMEMDCRRKLKSRAYAAMVIDAPFRTWLASDGDDWSTSRKLVLPEWPVTAVRSITAIDDNGTSRVIDITGLRPLPSMKGVIYLPRDVPTQGFQTLTLDVDAGYDAALHPREFTALRFAQLRWMQVAFQDQLNGTGRGTGFNVGGDSVSLIDVAIPKDVAAMLRPFRRIM